MPIISTMSSATLEVISEETEYVDISAQEEWLFVSMWSNDLTSLFQRNMLSSRLSVEESTFFSSVLTAATSGSERLRSMSNTLESISKVYRVTKAAFSELAGVQRSDIQLLPITFLWETNTFAADINNSSCYNLRARDSLKEMLGRTLVKNDLVMFLGEKALTESRDGSHVVRSVDLNVLNPCQRQTPLIVLRIGMTDGGGAGLPKAASMIEIVERQSTWNCFRFEYILNHGSFKYESTTYLPAATIFGQNHLLNFRRTMLNPLKAGSDVEQASRILRNQANELTWRIQHELMSKGMLSDTEVESGDSDEPLYIRRMLKKTSPTSTFKKSVSFDTSKNMLYSPPYSGPFLDNVEGIAYSFFGSRTTIWYQMLAAIAFLVLALMFFAPGQPGHVYFADVPPASANQTYTQMAYEYYQVLGEKLKTQVTGFHFVK